MPSNSQPSLLVRMTLSSEMAEAIDAFQTKEKLPNRNEALRLLLEIALDTVNEKGGRFWDAPK